METILNRLVARLKRSALRDWDLFIMCDGNRDRAVRQGGGWLAAARHALWAEDLQLLWSVFDLNGDGRIKFEECDLRWGSTLLLLTVKKRAPLTPWKKRKPGK